MRLSDWVLLGIILLVLLTVSARRPRRGRSGGRKPGSGDNRARQVLEEAGFELLEVQPSLTVNMAIQGRPHRFEMKSDYLAARGGRKYLVRLRRDARPVRLNSKAWRNALLRDMLLFGTCGVLVLDLDKEAVTEVHFQF